MRRWAGLFFALATGSTRHLLWLAAAMGATAALGDEPRPTHLEIEPIKIELGPDGKIETMAMNSAGIYSSEYRGPPQPEPPPPPNPRRRNVHPSAAPEIILC